MVGENSLKNIERSKIRLQNRLFIIKRKNVWTETHS